MLREEAPQECSLWVSVRAVGVVLSSAPFRPVHLGNAGDRHLGQTWAIVKMVPSIRASLGLYFPVNRKHPGQIKARNE